VRVQTFVQTNRQQVPQHTMGVRVKLLTHHTQSRTGQRLAEFGSLVDVSETLEDALSSILDDPLGFDLFVMDCDAFGGIPGAERAISSLIAADARMRVMLVSREFDVPAYPLGRRSAVCLPDDVSDASFRIGFDHVLRDRAQITMN
jgi:hypothetical protein